MTLKREATAKAGGLNRWNRSKKRAFNLKVQMAASVLDSLSMLEKYRINSVKAGSTTFTKKGKDELEINTIIKTKKEGIMTKGKGKEKENKKETSKKESQEIRKKVEESKLRKIIAKYDCKEGICKRYTVGKLGDDISGALYVKPGTDTCEDIIICFKGSAEGE